MNPKLKANLLGAAVGVIVFGALAAFPFAPLEVATTAGVLIGLASIALIRSLLDPTFLLGEEYARDDDGSGERPVWSSIDVDQLSPFRAWANGDSFLPGPDDTQEMPKPGSDDRTRVYNSGLFDLRASRPEGKHRAAVRS